jgi:hypothetical protein
MAKIVGELVFDIDRKSIKTTALFDSEFVKIEFTKNQRDPSRPGPIIMSSQTSKDAASPDTYRYLLNPNMLKR